MNIFNKLLVGIMILHTVTGMDAEQRLRGLSREIKEASDGADGAAAADSAASAQQQRPHDEKEEERVLMLIKPDVQKADREAALKEFIEWIGIDKIVSGKILTMTQSECEQLYGEHKGRQISEKKKVSAKHVLDKHKELGDKIVFPYMFDEKNELSENLNIIEIAGENVQGNNKTEIMEKLKSNPDEIVVLEGAKRSLFSEISSYMMSNPVVAMEILVPSVDHARNFIGDKAAHDQNGDKCLRSKYGHSWNRRTEGNGFHCSDSQLHNGIKSGDREVKLLKEWKGKDGFIDLKKSDLFLRCAEQITPAEY